MAPPPTGAALTADQPREGIKDTIDSIVVAFIMAFAFRAFIIEAFVIPTGSMAATLYGKHGTVTCECCGWEFAYGLADQTAQQLARGDRSAITENTPIVCQNCGHKNFGVPVNDVSAPGGNAEPGDRILVYKWPWDIGGSWLGPHRWDVTVFKDPSKGPMLGPGPGSQVMADGTQNYIKRLAGLPNEVLEIIDGDVYTAPVSTLSAETMAAFKVLRHVKYLEYGDDNVSTPTPAEREQARAALEQVRPELNRKLHICRKTPTAQQALWTVVYHHDYPPQPLGPGQPYWGIAPGSQPGWDTTERKIRGRFEGPGVGEVVFSGKGGRNYISDFCAYNDNPMGNSPENAVSDLKLEAVLVTRGGNGYLRMALSKYADTFWAEVRADGRVALYRTSGITPPSESAEPLCSARLRQLPADRPVEMAFENVDYRVSLTIDGTEVLATTDRQYLPDVDALRPLSLEPVTRRISPMPRIAASNLDFELWHVVLSRDVYYSALGSDRSGPGGGNTGWGESKNPIWLGEKEYFMLGDNSPASKDSRLWDNPGDHLASRGEAYQLGTVPEDQLIGRAFFVYWPAGHRSELVPFLRNLGLIPNFGRMRWIR